MKELYNLRNALLIDIDSTENILKTADVKDQEYYRGRLHTLYVAALAVYQLMIEYKQPDFSLN